MFKYYKKKKIKLAMPNDFLQKFQFDQSLYKVKINDYYELTKSD